MGAPPRWIERLDEAPLRLDAPLVWIVRHAAAAEWLLPPPEATDLADASLAKREGGGGRVLRRRLLRALVARVFALHPATMRFTRDARGRPGLAALPAFVSTAGCMAEAQPWSAVALAPRPVGVDLEAGPPADALARWTLTEAYLKALGDGLATPPERVGMQPDVEAGTWRMTLQGAAEGRGEVRPMPAVTAALVVLQADTLRV